MPALLRKSCNKVHRNLLKGEGAFLCGDAVERYLPSMSHDFILLADCASFHIVRYPLSHPCPCRISAAFRIVSSRLGCPAVGWSWMRVIRFLLEESGIRVTWVAFTKSFGSRRVWSLLLSSP